MTDTSRCVRQRDGIPVFDYRTDPAIPRVTLLQLDSGHPRWHKHIHEFPALVYAPGAGVVAVVAAGQVIEPAAHPLVEHAVAVFFDPAVLGDDTSAPWFAHPLLFPFQHRQSGGLLRLELPTECRPRWDVTIAAIDTELTRQDSGYRQAVAAHLTLLLVDIARLAADVVTDPRRGAEPLLVEVYDLIEARFRQPFSLRDIADMVGMTPGYLTSVVRDRTGRTVQQWIIDRRMTEARRLLIDTDLPIAEIARRVGIPDPGYFTRLFRRENHASPRAWRSMSE
ncbi:transcriptional regulatory protein [Nocardia brasiliensis ATCC 700358]|uniref:Transcriptional regulatory protein n=1 Tax=Nocardia brasiliensis (strain ATCC 700358 / HUJEG-1) TaxID=1133849 RepID=K0F5Q7_NOCB7|nr:AraC family transcriptional regulator [Nocardia brasiliensis]AFU02776.1 transcriptional regulatory protein [Nocardia brasiliensis ATCC 700358]